VRGDRRIGTIEVESRLVEPPGASCAWSTAGPQQLLVVRSTRARLAAQQDTTGERQGADTAKRHGRHGAGVRRCGQAEPVDRGPSAIGARRGSYHSRGRSSPRDFSAITSRVRVAVTAYCVYI